jgi:hypothetical protein
MIFSPPDRIKSFSDERDAQSVVFPSFGGVAAKRPGW